MFGYNSPVHPEAMVSIAEKASAEFFSLQLEEHLVAFQVKGENTSEGEIVL